MSENKSQMHNIRFTPAELAHYSGLPMNALALWEQR
jgi:hypothetical protein